MEEQEKNKEKQAGSRLPDPSIRLHNYSGSVTLKNGKIAVSGCGDRLVITWMQGRRMAMMREKCGGDGAAVCDAAGHVGQVGFRYCREAPSAIER